MTPAFDPMYGKRKEAEAALHAHEVPFRLLADQIPQLVWMAHADGDIFWYNQRWYDYTGMTPASQAGWGWQRVHDPAVLPQVLERWGHSLATGEAFAMVFPLKGADGQFRPFLTRVQPVKDATGQVVQWFGTNTDITEQQATEAALRAANQLKDEFLSIASHELRTPLTSAKANLQLALRWLTKLEATDTPLRVAGSGAPLRLLLERSAVSLDRLEGLVGDLVDVVRIEAGKLVLRRTRLDLRALVRAVVADELLAWSGRVIHLKERLADDTDEPVWGEGDANRLRQVVNNYLSNALKYAPSDRPITVRLVIQDDALYVAVSDQGPGLTPEQQAHVFEQFYQVADISPQQGSQVGLGLGLYICRTMMEQHGGMVGVESTPDAGSTFWFTLPLTKGDA